MEESQDYFPIHWKIVRAGIVVFGVWAAPTLGVPSFPRRLRRSGESSVIPAHAGIQVCTSAPTFFLRLQVRAGSRPGRRPTFLFAQESRQRSAPRLPGPSGYPRCGRPAGPVAKLAALGQRDRTSPGEPPSLGGSEGNERRRACALYTKTKLNPIPIAPDPNSTNSWTRSVIDDVEALTFEFTGAARLYRAASGGMMGWAYLFVSGASCCRHLFCSKKRSSFGILSMQRMAKRTRRRR